MPIELFHSLALWGEVSVTDMRSVVLVFVFALGWSSLSGLGQDTEKRSSGIAPQRAVADVQKTNPSSDGRPDYSAESFVFERLDAVYRYHADGAGEHEISAVLLIQSDAAARQYGVLTVPFAGDNQRVEFDYVRVRKPNGSLVETPVTDAQEMPQEVTRQAPFYSDLKEKQLPVRNLQVGDRIEYRLRIPVTIRWSTKRTFKGGRRRARMPV